jgi:hypothetical protein
MKAGIGELRGLRKGTDKSSCPLCLGKEDAKSRDKYVENRIFK